MGKLFIGIDYSLSSIGVTFRINEETRYVSFINRYKLSSSKPENRSMGEVISGNDTINTIINSSNLHVKPFARKPVPTTKKIGLVEWSRLHISSVITLGKEIYTGIKETIQEHYSDIALEDVYICFENYSYGSSTDNLIQVVEATMKLKDLLLENMMIPLSNFYIVAGPTLKMWVGNGGYDKRQMLIAYVENHKNDPGLEDDDFYKVVSKDVRKFIKNNKKKDVKTPIDDIVDSYFLSLWLEEKVGINNL